LRIAYQRLTDPDAIIHRLCELAPRTVVVDVEPLIAVWDSGQSSLSRGVAHFLEQVATAPGLAAVCFATNSRRHLLSAIASDSQAVRYLASARKPMRTAAYLDLPRPGVVIGDQVATDGFLAWRLGYSFIHYDPNCHIPLGPRLMRYLGYSIQPFLFNRRGDNSDSTVRKSPIR